MQQNDYSDAQSTVVIHLCLCQESCKVEEASIASSMDLNGVFGLAEA